MSELFLPGVLITCRGRKERESMPFLGYIPTGTFGPGETTELQYVPDAEGWGYYLKLTHDGNITHIGLDDDAPGVIRFEIGTADSGIPITPVGMPALGGIETLSFEFVSYDDLDGGNYTAFDQLEANKVEVVNGFWNMSSYKLLNAPKVWLAPEVFSSNVFPSTNPSTPPSQVLDYQFQIGVIRMASDAQGYITGVFVYANTNNEGWEWLCFNNSGTSSPIVVTVQPYLNPNLDIKAVLENDKAQIATDTNGGGAYSLEDQFTIEIDFTQLWYVGSGLMSRIDTASAFDPQGDGLQGVTLGDGTTEGLLEAMLAVLNANPNYIMQKYSNGPYTDANTDGGTKCVLPYVDGPSKYTFHVANDQWSLVYDVDGTNHSILSGPTGTTTAYVTTDTGTTEANTAAGTATMIEFPVDGAGNLGYPVAYASFILGTATTGADPYISPMLV
jgi:hypothetical protein